MSRPYRVKIDETVTRGVCAQDGFTSQVPLVDMGPAEDRAKILLDELEKRGYKKDPCGTSASKTVDGVNISIGGDGSIEGKAEETREVSASRNGTVNWDTDYGAEEKAKEAVRAELRDQIAKEEKKMQDSLTARVERVYQQTVAEAKEVANEVARQQVDAATRRLGEVVEREETKDGLRVKVRT